MADKDKKQAQSTLPSVVSEETLPDTVQPMTLIEQAINGGVEVEKLERLFDLQERWEAAKAKTAFFRAMANFQAEIPAGRRS